MRTVRGWHAGERRLQCGDTFYEKFNDFSSGIELVFFDGNIYPYTEAQIESLIEVLKDLHCRFPTSRDNARIVGHESIAGFRGKIDPRKLFRWERVLEGISCSLG